MNSGLICIWVCPIVIGVCNHIYIPTVIYNLQLVIPLQQAPPKKIKALPRDTAMLLLTFGATLALSILSNKPKAGCHWRPWRSAAFAEQKSTPTGSKAPKTADKVQLLQAAMAAL